MSIQSANTRQTAYDNCMTMQAQQSYIDAQEAARLAAIEGHYGRVIANWCNQDGNTADSSNISLTIMNQVSTDWANAQTATLEGAGYVVNTTADTFTISLP